MANEHLVTKWKMYWKMLDVNHDGTISEKDRDASRKAFCQLHNMHDEVEKKVMDIFGTWWNRFIFHGSTGKVTEAEFIAKMNKDFTADKAKFRQEMFEGVSLIIHVFDIERDGTMTEEEFLKAWKAFGHEHVKEEMQMFEDFNPKNGEIPVKEFIEAWTDFLTNDDPSKKEIVKTALERGI